MNDKKKRINIYSIIIIFIIGYNVFKFVTHTPKEYSIDFEPLFYIFNIFICFIIIIILWINFEYNKIKLKKENKEISKEKENRN